MLILGLVDVPLWLILVPAIGVLLYWYGTRNHDHFKKAGIPGPTPWPFVGNFVGFIRRGFYDVDFDLQKKYGNTVGTFNGNRPNLVIFDQEMISQVMVKQFPYFMNRQTFSNGDKIMEAMLTQMEDDLWKHTRSTMSPSFTTGKLRKMAGEINRCAKQLSDNLTSSKEPFETMKYAGAYTMDVIASTAFGLRVDSQSSNENAFVSNGKRMMNISFRNPVTVAMFILPRLGKILTKLGWSLFDRQAMKFFVDVVKQTLDSRKEGDTSRNDFIQLMSNAKLGNATYNKEDEHEVEKLSTDTARKGMTEDQILGNALIFFLAGFDTTSVGLTQLLYCLAMNPECQQKVCKEIDDIIGDKETIAYDDVMKMQYLDQCMQESLRLYPGAPRVDRAVKEDITINGIYFKKGSIVTIPVYALHKDNDIWPNADKFDPERFSPEEKHRRNPISWLPFGYGPRNCIGLRLAAYELKVAVVYILKNHKLVTCEKTENPIVWQKGKWLKSQNGIWLKAEKRK